MIWYLEIILLAIVQGLAELLPVSSSAHVIVTEKLMKMDPTTPKNVMMLVMLHTGTMFAVIVYFWRTWRKSVFGSAQIFKKQAVSLILATGITLAIGWGLKKGIEKAAAHSGLIAHPSGQKVEMEQLFGNLGLVAAVLAAAGVLILVAGLMSPRDGEKGPVGPGVGIMMGIVQAFCIPLRGFSRSGATISTGMLAGSAKANVEEFSFALAVLLTPAAIAWEVMRVARDQPIGQVALSVFAPSLLGMFFAFLAGLVALKWLSSWLENGKWYWFGVYCLGFAVVVAALYVRGF